MPKIDIIVFQEKARQYREDILTMVSEAGSGHIGGSFSGVEILISLYHYKMRHNPENPSWSQRDKFIMSKGLSQRASVCNAGRPRIFPQRRIKDLS